MSLADRIKSAQPNSNRAGVCQSCRWLKTVKPATKKLIDDWLAAGYSRLQLYDILSTPGEDIDEPLLAVSPTAWRMHCKHHSERCRGTQ